MPPGRRPKVYQTKESIVTRGLVLPRGSDSWWNTSMVSTTISQTKQFVSPLQTRGSDDARGSIRARFPRNPSPWVSSCEAFVWRSKLSDSLSMYNVNTPPRTTPRLCWVGRCHRHATKTLDNSLGNRQPRLRTKLAQALLSQFQSFHPRLLDPSAQRASA